MTAYTCYIQDVSIVFMFTTFEHAEIDQNCKDDKKNNSNKLLCIMYKYY